ncbi:MAG: glycosyltransferase family 2 protein [Thermoplasmata archaeon]
MVDISVVIPTRNEEASIGRVLDEVNKAFEGTSRTYEILVVDTLSEDRTVAIAQEKGARVVPENRRGYGRAYKTGFKASKGELIATLDADWTYPAHEIPRIATLLEEEGWDFVSGDRLSYLDPEAMEVHHRLGNALLNKTAHLLYGVRLRDSQSGMWVFRREILDQLTLGSVGMPFSEELKLEVVEKGLRFKEIPIHYRPRVGEAKIRSLADGWGNIRFLVKRRLRPPA